MKGTVFYTDRVTCGMKSAKLLDPLAGGTLVTTPGFPLGKIVNE